MFHYYICLRLGNCDILICVFVVQGVIDVTTTEVADYVVGGIMACGPNRFQAILQQRIPLVLSVGALDMVNFGNKSAVPAQFAKRLFHVHNDQVSRVLKAWVTISL